MLTRLKHKIRWRTHGISHRKYRVFFVVIVWFRTFTYFKEYDSVQFEGKNTSSG